MKKYYGFLIGAVLSAIFCSIRVVQLYNEFFIIKQYTVTKVLIVYCKEHTGEVVKIKVKYKYDKSTDDYTDIEFISIEE